MALPNGAGGYQIGDGNLNEADIYVANTPVSLATATTLTASQLANGVLLVNSGLTASSVAYTLPTVSDLEATFSSATKVGSSFDFRVVNLGTASATAIVTTNTGWTITGSLTMTIPVTTGALLRAIKTGDGTWSLYRLA